MTADAKTHDPGWVVTLYPIMINGAAFSGALISLLIDIPERRQLSIRPCSLIVTGLPLPAIVYTFSGTPPWECCFVDGIPGVVITALILTWLSYQ